MSHMDPMRRTALVAGLFYLVTFISIPTLALYGPVKTDPDFIIGSGPDLPILLGTFLEMVVALAGIGTSVALFSVLKRQRESFALGFVTTRVFEATMIGIGVISLLGIVTLRQPGATGAEATALTTVGSALVSTYNGTFLLGQSLMPAFNALLLGTLLYRSRLVPRALPMLGLIGAPFQLAVVTLILFGVLEQYSVGSIAAIPIAAWELSLGLWLTFKGFRSDAPLMVAEADRAPGAERFAPVAGAA